MKSRTIKFVFILSLIFNVAFLGGLGYRLLGKRPVPFLRHRLLKGKGYYEHFHCPPEIRERLRCIQREFPKKISSIRPHLFTERTILADLLKSETPDSILIEQQLDKISNLQKEIEREVVYQLLREKNEMPPEMREQFLDIVVKRLGRGYPHPEKFIKDREGMHHKRKMKHKPVEEENQP